MSESMPKGLSKTTYIASWLQRVPIAMGWAEIGANVARVALRIAPGVKSMGPRNILVKGSVMLCFGSDSQLHLLHSIPRTPSVPIRLGHVRVMDAGFWSP